MWAKYEARFKKHRTAMHAFIADIAKHFEVKEDFTNLDDYAYFVIVDHPSGKKVAISFEMVDSGDADDGIYGVHGNFNLKVVESGGRIIGGFVPENYTGRVWVPYEDDAEWEGRLNASLSRKDDIIHLVEQWRTHE
jgi:hypothetical protein